MQILHQKEYSRESEKAKTSLGPGRKDPQTDDDLVIQPELHYRTMRSRAGSRVARSSDGDSTHRGLPSSNSDGALAKYLKAGSGLPAIPSSSLDMEGDTVNSLRTRSELASSSRTIGRARSASRLTKGSRAESVYVAREEAVSLHSDEQLDSTGLRQAIQAAKQEMARLVAEFDELESATSARLGQPSVLSRRGSALVAPPASPTSLSTEDRRRLSVSSSSGYSSSAGGLAQSRISLASPPPSILRRPSKASSIVSSTSAAGQQEGYFRPVSTLFEEEEDLRVTFGESRMQEPLHREVVDIRDRKESVQRRYKARIDFLEAKLQSQLIKDKIRR